MEIYLSESKNRLIGGFFVIWMLQQPHAPHFVALFFESHYADALGGAAEGGDGVKRDANDLAIDRDRHQIALFGVIYHRHADDFSGLCRYSHGFYATAAASLHFVF